jgi:hypothetical protein
MPPATAKTVSSGPFTKAEKRSGLLRLCSVNSIGLTTHGSISKSPAPKSLVTNGGSSIKISNLVHSWINDKIQSIPIVVAIQAGTFREVIYGQPGHTFDVQFKLIDANTDQGIFSFEAEYIPFIQPSGPKLNATAEKFTQAIQTPRAHFLGFQFAVTLEKTTEIGIRGASEFPLRQIYRVQAIGMHSQAESLTEVFEARLKTIDLEDKGLTWERLGLDIEAIRRQPRPRRSRRGKGSW